jgi:hypothetical protein
MTTQWKRATVFAEYAEALQVDTLSVMAVSAQDDRFMVFYTPDEPEQIWSATLARDPDGILRVVGVAHEEVGLWEQLKDSLR